MHVLKAWFYTATDLYTLLLPFLPFFKKVFSFVPLVFIITKPVRVTQACIYTAADLYTLSLPSQLPPSTIHEMFLIITNNECPPAIAVHCRWHAHTLLLHNKKLIKKKNHHSSLYHTINTLTAPAQFPAWKSACIHACKQCIWWAYNKSTLILCFGRSPFMRSCKKGETP